MMRERLPLMLVWVSAIVVAGQSTRLAGQAGGGAPGIWEGAYTAAQAEHGKARFTAVCRRCHNDDLGGSDRGPTLRGERFMANWETQELSSLWAKARNTMPPDSPASLSDDDYVDVVTYILQANGFPTGNRILGRDDLEGIVIARRAGEAPREIPNFRLVRVVGCLVRGPGTNWILTNSGEPAQTSEQPPSSAAPGEAAAQPLGSQSFRLVSVDTFHPADHEGQKMEARGLIYRARDKNLINLMSLEAVGGHGCGS